MAQLNAYQKEAIEKRARDQWIAQIDQDIRNAQNIQAIGAGAVVGPDGELIVSKKEAQDVLNQSEILAELNRKKDFVTNAPLETELVEPQSTIAASTVRQLGRYARVAGGNIRRWGGRVNNDLARLPTPGDVWTPIVILLFFFIVLVQVNGFSRLQWLWMAFLGDAAISSANQTPQAPTNPPTRQGGPQQAQTTQVQVSTLQPQIVTLPGQAGPAVPTSVPPLPSFLDYSGLGGGGYIAILQGAGE